MIFLIRPIRRSYPIEARTRVSEYQKIKFSKEKKRMVLRNLFNKIYVN